MSEALSGAEKGKFNAAKAATALVKDGMKVGLGTGSTAAWLVRHLAEMVRNDGLRIQAAATLREHQLNGFKYEAAKWTIDDEVCKLSKQVEMSRDNIIVKFLNYQEDWEEDKIRTKNRAHESLLNDKYQHVYLYDSDTQETRRILHVEWSTAHRPAKYAVVTQFVHGIHENEEDDLVSYYINESLFDCIRAAPLPYNQQRRLIERPN